MKPRPSRYDSATLKNFVIFLKSVQLFRHQLGHSKEEQGLHCVGSFAKAGWKLWPSGNGLWGSRNQLWLANRYRPVTTYLVPPGNVPLGLHISKYTVPPDHKLRNILSGGTLRFEIYGPPLKAFVPQDRIFRIMF